MRGDPGVTMALALEVRVSVRSGDPMGDPRRSPFSRRAPLARRLGLPFAVGLLPPALKLLLRDRPHASGLSPAPPLGLPVAAGRRSAYAAAAASAAAARSAWRRARSCRSAAPRSHACPSSARTSSRDVGSGSSVLATKSRAAAEKLSGSGTGHCAAASIRRTVASLLADENGARPVSTSNLFWRDGSYHSSQPSQTDGPSGVTTLPAPGEREGRRFTRTGETIAPALRDDSPPAPERRRRTKKPPKASSTPIWGGGGGGVREHAQGPHVHRLAVPRGCVRAGVSDPRRGARQQLGCHVVRRAQPRARALRRLVDAEAWHGQPTRLRARVSPRFTVYSRVARGELATPGTPGWV